MSSTTEIILKEDIAKGLAALRSDAEAIVIRSQQDYIEAVQIKNAANSYIKDVKAKLGPGIASAKDHLDFLKNEMAKYIMPAEKIRDTVEAKRVAFAEEEKRKAEAEQRRINEENRRIAAEKAEAERKERELAAAELRERERKEIEAARKAGDVNKREAERLKKEADAKAERERIAAAEEARLAAQNVQEVTVKAAIPTVAGAKNQTFYYAELLDSEPIYRDFIKAIEERNIPRFTFLRRFLMVDEQELRKFARDTKDNLKSSAAVPGVRFWSKG